MMFDFGKPGQDIECPRLALVETEGLSRVHKEH